MRNRAKCKLCNSIIESYHLEDYVTCSCGEIAISGGNIKYYVSAKDYNNLLRIDDEGNQIVVTIKDEKEGDPPKDNESPISEKPSRHAMMSMLDEMIKSHDNLPKHAMTSPITHYDLAAALIVIYGILKSEDGEINS
jgi:hypothetical protein